MKEEIRQKLTGAVIGLARTCQNNEKTESTNRVFLEALTMAGDWSASIFDMSEMLEKVRNEKYTVSPGCVTCAAPCGNTDDYDMENLWKTSLRKKVLFQINEILETRLPIPTPG